MGRQAVIALGVLLACCACASAFDPSLDVSQYAHAAWTVRDGFFKGNIYAMTQTPDGYLWLGTEFGLLRFDGVRSVPWQPPAGQHLPDKNITALLVTRDGTLWIGTAVGLVTWSGGKLTRRPELGDQFVASLFEDRDGTVWAGTLADSGRLCALRTGSVQCHGEDGAFGRAVWALFEDSSGTLWAGAQSGLWRMKPGPARRYPTPTELIGLSKADDGRLLIAMHAAGLMQFVGDKVEPYPVRSAIDSNKLLPDRDIDSNRLLRDRDGGLWIGTVERGLVHVHNGRTDVFTQSDGLSGNVVLSLFEDREGNVWVATTGGLDRFRELPVTTISGKQGLSSDATQSVLAATDGSIWVGAHEGLSRWKNGQTTVFGKASGLPDDAPQSLFQDDRGRIWVSTAHELAYFEEGRFVATNALPGGRIHFITGDKAGNVWLSEEKSLLHLLQGRLVEQIPWSELGRSQRAQVLLSGREPGIAGELHDGVLQQITSVTLRLSKVRNKVQGDSEANATVSGLQQQLIKIGTDIRHISHELHPALLQEAGLPAALSAYCAEFSNVRGFPVSCETDESVKELSPGAALCIYRIAQEALGNAAKYSESKKVEVRLTRSDGRVCLSVSDDGVGCTPNQIGKSGGLGLINMRERVHQLDGTFEFDSEPGHGTTVRVTVPFRTAS